MRFVFALAYVTIALCSVGPARAQATDPSAPLTVYVGAFQPAQLPATPGGPVHSLASSIRTHHVDRNAERLSGAIVRALASHNAQAQALPAGGPPPSSGWIVRGVFYALASDQHLIPAPLLSGNKNQPNVEVSVTIADAAKDPAVPFAVIGTDAAVKGQGGAIAWNPYVIAAHFAVQSVEADKSIDALAEDIAAQILANRETLDQHDKIPAVLSPDSDASHPASPAGALQ